MKVTLNPNAKDAATRDALVAEGGFGKYYTDHMVVCEWTEKDGWAEPELKPYGPLSLDPATAVFHYGQEIFEGMKAYRQPDGSISLFRPDANAKRFANSAKRLALPEMPEALFLETVETLVKQDAGWVPNKIGESLYIRPFMIATEVGLGVRPTNKATYILIALIHQRLFLCGFQLNMCEQRKVEQVKQSVVETMQPHLLHKKLLRKRAAIKLYGLMQKSASGLKRWVA